jgi:uncharacterized C2H2 Zn-finger protein
MNKGKETNRIATKVVMDRLMNRNSTSYWQCPACWVIFGELLDFTTHIAECESYKTLMNKEQK